MSSEVCVDELMDEENVSGPSISIAKVADELLLHHGIVEPKNVVVVVVLSQSPKPAGNERPSSSTIGPLTPDSNRENGEQSHHDASSPLTVVSSPLLYAPCSSDAPKSSSSSSLETPNETLFDSFSPGPDKFMLAPRQSKYREESRNHVVRRLNFMCTVEDFSHESSMGTLSDEEEHLFEIVYSTVLDAIISEQTEELPTQGSGIEGGLRTPKYAPVLSGVAETCPGAPIKSTSKYRIIDNEICRKLEF